MGPSLAGLRSRLLCLQTSLATCVEFRVHFSILGKKKRASDSLSASTWWPSSAGSTYYGTDADTETGFGATEGMLRGNSELCAARATSKLSDTPKAISRPGTSPFPLLLPLASLGRTLNPSKQIRERRELLKRREAVTIIRSPSSELLTGGRGSAGAKGCEQAHRGSRSEAF